MTEFVSGWLHFWTAFAQSWLFFAGFAVASLVSTIFYLILKTLVLLVWWRI